MKSNRIAIYESDKENRESGNNLERSESNRKVSKMKKNIVDVSKVSKGSSPILNNKYSCRRTVDKDLFVLKEKQDSISLNHQFHMDNYFSDNSKTIANQNENNISIKSDIQADQMVVPLNIRQNNMQAKAAPANEDKSLKTKMFLNEILTVSFSGQNVMKKTTPKLSSNNISISKKYNRFNAEKIDNDCMDASESYQDQNNMSDNLRGALLDVKSNLDNLDLKLSKKNRGKEFEAFNFFENNPFANQIKENLDSSKKKENVLQDSLKEIQDSRSSSSKTVKKSSRNNGPLVREKNQEAINPNTLSRPENNQSSLEKPSIGDNYDSMIIHTTVGCEDEYMDLMAAHSHLEESMIQNHYTDDEYLDFNNQFYGGHRVAEIANTLNAKNYEKSKNYASNEILVKPNQSTMRAPIEQEIDKSNYEAELVEYFIPNPISIGSEDLLKNSDNLKALAQMNDIVEKIEETAFASAKEAYDLIREYVELSQHQVFAKLEHYFFNTEAQYLFSRLLKLERWAILFLLSFIVNNLNKKKTSDLELEELFHRLLKFALKNQNKQMTWFAVIRNSLSVKASSGAMNNFTCNFGMEFFEEIHEN